MREDAILYTRTRVQGWLTHWWEIELEPEERADIYAACGKLTVEQWDVVKLVMLGYSLREISQRLEMGKSATPARRIFERALTRMEEVLNGTTRAPR